MIDWTLPVETTEDPPRPVRVLCTDAGEQYPIVALISREPILFTKDGHEWPDGCGITLRNVPPPKPDPVLREAWVVFKEAPNCWVFTDYAHAKNCADANGFPMARAAVMSDGSPVPGDFHDDLEWTELTADRDNWKAEAELLANQNGMMQVEINRLNSLLTEATTKAEALEAEVDRMKPVVDAAVAWASQDQLGRLSHILSHIRKAVRTYQSKQSPAAPVKKCDTCRHQNGYGCYRLVGPCTAADKWEPRHD